MRYYKFTTEQKLCEDEKNRSGVLFNLCQNNDKRKFILDFIHSLTEQDISNINFIYTQRGEAISPTRRLVSEAFEYPCHAPTIGHSGRRCTHSVLARGMCPVGRSELGGSGGIRTHERLAPLLVFKTSAFNHSATLPFRSGA